MCTVMGRSDQDGGQFVVRPFRRDEIPTTYAEIELFMTSLYLRLLVRAGHMPP